MKVLVYGAGVIGSIEEDGVFDAVIARAPEYPTPNWNALRAQVPDRETLRALYGKRDKA